MNYPSNQPYIIDHNAKSRTERSKAIERAYMEALSEALCFQLEDATPDRIHAKVIELRASQKLTPALMLAMVRRGATAFTESALALYSGRDRHEIRSQLEGANREALDALLQAAGIEGALVPTFLTALRKCYGNSALRH